MIDIDLDNEYRPESDKHTRLMDILYILTAAAFFPSMAVYRDPSDRKLKYFNGHSYAAEDSETRDYHARIAWRMATFPSEFTGWQIIPNDYSTVNLLWAAVWPEHPDRTIKHELGKPWPLPPGLDLDALPESDRDAYRRLNS